MRKVVVGVALALCFAPSARAATASTRILYMADWTGHTEVYALDPSGRQPVAQLTHWGGACPELPDRTLAAPISRQLAVSSDGRYVLARCDRVGWLMRANGESLRELTPGERFAWEGSASGTSTNRQWSPDRSKLAIERRDGLRIYDAKTKRTRLITRDLGFSPEPTEYAHDFLGFGLAWSPDSRRIAYVTGKQTVNGAGWSISSGDLMTATPAGTTRMVVSRDHADGGHILAVAWAKVPKGTRYAAADPVPRERVAPNGLLANGHVQRLAADASRVAFIACNRIVVWTPSTETVDTRGVSDRPGECLYNDLSGRYYLYDLALAGDRVAYLLSEGCMSIRITLYLQRLDAAPAQQEIRHSGGNCAGPFSTALGRMSGSGDLLVFGQWHEDQVEAPPDLVYPVTEARINRIDGASCPCPTIVSTLGPLYPADVDNGRVLAYGTKRTLLVDRNGEQLLSLATTPETAQLAGDDLVLLDRGSLRHYDVRAAALLHTWPLPDVPSGPTCGWLRCTPSQRLALADAARGLVAYVLDGQLHVLRLVDGADAIVGQAALARFMDTGLVYANGARLHLVPFASLPLVGF
jgi:hypothetical protein